MKRSIAVVTDTASRLCLFINSYHHQSIKDLGECLNVVAYSKDWVVEVAEKEGEDFVVGIQ